MGSIKVHPEPLDSPAAAALLEELVDDIAMACGGYRRLDDDTAELKRMYVSAAGRRQGLARRILSELEADAVKAGYRHMWLEAGVPQFEALSLYPAAGYTPIASFGQFAGEPQQRCYGKTLA